MSATQLITKLSSLGINIWLENYNLRYKAPHGALTADLKHEIIANKEALIVFLKENSSVPSISIQSDPRHRYEPFPLTELQEAYWVGEKDFYRMKAVPYLYHEHEIVTLDVERFQNAVNALIERHEILRTSVLSNGTQIIQQQVPKYKVDYRDISHLPQSQIRDILETKRTHIEACLPNLEAGQPFYFCIHRLPDCFRLHIAFRLIAIDGVSLNVLYSDLLNLYNYNDYIVSRETKLSYRDYVLAIDSYKHTETYQISLQYWKSRIDTLPPAPDLPKRSGLESSTESLGFCRLSGRLSRERWISLQKQARQCGLSINMVLCGLYTETLRLWSKNKEFTLNVLSANRPMVDPEMQYLVGNCGTTSLLEIANTKGTFAERVRALQKQMYIDLEHNCVSGVAVIRELVQRKGGTREPLMPIVFTSGLELAKDLEGFPINSDEWNYIYGSLKTPQVWLDHQVYEEKGDLVFNWDFTPEVFPGEMINDMFNHYQAHMDALAAEPVVWDAEPPFAIAKSQLIARERANSTEKELPQGLLHSFFNSQAKINGTRLAIITEQHQLTYEEVYAWSMTICNKLKSSGVKPNDVVGILVKKGWEQIVAILGVLQAGAAYLPLDTKLPSARINYILEHSFAKSVITDSMHLNYCQFPACTSVIEIPCKVKPSCTIIEPEELQSPSDTAYVIYTSGSTGNPKGVVIDHRGAVNTIQDIISRFNINENDRIIALSALNFDLSVFDIFGALSAGAALVIPNDNSIPEPKIWAECLINHKVTIWNSVPALLEMTLEFLGDRKASILNQLRLVLLSGDWISLSLVERFKKINSTAQFIGLGGATEASIWSNFFPIHELAPTWRSIRYGFPLSNQQLHILDENLEPTPVWAVGELYIGGKGLAKGYLNDKEKTVASFIIHPKTGNRLYKTGDIGRYSPEGEIEFLGRKDYQVKIRGFRIELGEIEATLMRHPAIKSAVALVHSTSSLAQTLIAFVVCNETIPISYEVKSYLADILPAYMVPGIIVQVDNLPLSANGKIDRKALLANFTTYSVLSTAKVSPRNSIEEILARIWSGLLNISHISVEENFFQLGGNSLLAVRLINEIERKFERTLPLSSLLRDGTIEAQAKLIVKLGEKNVSALVLIKGKNQAKLPLFFIHPVGGNVLCYEEFAGFLNSDICLYGLQYTQSNAEEIDSYIEKTASAYITEILKAYPNGAIHLGGWSLGGIISCEMARQLKELGRSVGRIFMIDSWVGLDGKRVRFEHATAVAGFFRDFVGGISLHDVLKIVQSVPEAEQLNKAIKILRRTKRINNSISNTYFQDLFKVYLNNSKALQLYKPRSIPFEIDFFKAQNFARHDFPGLIPFVDPDNGWIKYVNACNIKELNADHYSIMTGEAIKQIAEQVNERLEVF
jgi:amino acid adenylation domain-containing protein